MNKETSTKLFNNVKDLLTILIVFTIVYCIGYGQAYYKYGCEKVADKSGNRWITCDLNHK